MKKLCSAIFVIIIVCVVSSCNLLMLKTVAFDSDGGTSVEDLSLLEGSIIIKPTSPHKDGYVFAGWYKDNLLTTLWNFSTVITEDQLLYAKWLVPTSDSSFVFEEINGDIEITKFIGSESEIVIPDTINGKSVSSIGIGAFSPDLPKGKVVQSHKSNISSIKIPDSVTTISKAAFYYCDSLTNITIPDSVTLIGEYAFKDCIRLTSVTLPDSVTSIGIQAFAYCRALINIKIPDSVTSIGGSALIYCSALTSIVIPDSVTSIGTHVFWECNGLISINCEVSDQPADWDSNWLGYSTATVTWGYIAD